MFRNCPSRRARTTAAGSLSPSGHPKYTASEEVTLGVISDPKKGSMPRPRLPTGVCSSPSRSKSDQLSPRLSFTLSRASDPFKKHMRLIKPPIGLPNTCPKPFGSVRGSGIAAKRVSLVPRLITTFPGFEAPIPTRLQGLSPEKRTTLQFGSIPWF